MRYAFVISLLLSGCSTPQTSAVPLMLPGFALVPCEYSRIKVKTNEDLIKELINTRNAFAACKIKHEAITKTIKE
jgi:hypothetical protein